MPLTFGSLFAGIGGFDLGFERAGMTCKWQVEIDDYANRVLQKHWPEVRRWRDVRTFPPSIQEYQSANPRDHDWHVDLICGGFPCQDISYAGRGAGIEGERSGLFFEAVRVVGQLRPRYVVLENVAALLSRGLDRVCGELAEIGYDAEWHCIPAAAVGAPHIRDRAFVIANSKSMGRNEGSGMQGDKGRERKRRGEFAGSGQTLADTASKGISEKRDQYTNEPEQQPSHRDHAIGCSLAAGIRNSTDSEWWSVEPEVGRVANGVPAALDIGGIVEYICEHGCKNKSDVAKASTTQGRDGQMRILRIYLELTTASPELGNPGSCASSLPIMPHESGLGEGSMGPRTETQAAMRDLPDLVSAEMLARDQDLQQRMPVDPREVQRWLAVGKRVDRLRGLGNAVVPQVAEWIGRRIVESMKTATDPTPAPRIRAGRLTARPNGRQ